MGKADSLQGSIDLLVLKILSRRPGLHGYAIMSGIREWSGEVLRVEEGSLYPALHRMEEKGWLAAEWKTSEGVSTSVPYREDEDAILADVVGGLRSGLTYAGSKTIKELQRKLNYVVVTPSGWRESMPHKLF